MAASLNDLAAVPRDEWVDYLLDHELAPTKTEAALIVRVLLTGEGDVARDAKALVRVPADKAVVALSTDASAAIEALTRVTEQLAEQVKELVRVPGYTRADGTRVGGYSYRRDGGGGVARADSAAAMEPGWANHLTGRELPAAIKPDRNELSPTRPDMHRSWHLTDRPDFRLDPEFKPFENYSATGGVARQPGLYVTDDPEDWAQGYDYVRPFIAEVEHPPIDEHYEGMPQGFLPADQFAESRVVRVIPIDEYVHERYGEPGWIEEFMGDAPKSIPKDYRYTGPDVRDMSSEQIARLRERWSAYMHSIHPQVFLTDEDQIDVQSQEAALQRIRGEGERLFEAARRRKKKYDPRQPRGEHTGEWVKVPGSGVPSLSQADQERWGESNEGSQAITGASAELLGLPHAGEPSARDTEIALSMLAAIKADKGSERPLFSGHSMSDERLAQFREGKPIRLALTATIGDEDFARQFTQGEPGMKGNNDVLLTFAKGTHTLNYGEGAGETDPLGQERITAGDFMVNAVVETEDPYWHTKLTTIFLSPAARQIPEIKALVRVPGYTRADGTHVDSYTYQREGGKPNVSESSGAAASSDKIVDCGADVEKAAEELANGNRIRLDQPREVSVLLDKLGEMTADAVAKGEKAPTYDLCKVSVKGTNLFCAQSKGIPRVQMPQLKGVVSPDSPAARLAKPDVRGETDITPQFRQHLLDVGYKIKSAKEKASYLRPSQNQLNGAKVAGITKFLRGGGKLDPQLFLISRDNYIVDGHHRWASEVAVDLLDNKPGDIVMDVEIVDIDIGTLLQLAREFAAENGIPQVGVEKSLVRVPGYTRADGTRVGGYTYRREDGGGQWADHLTDASAAPSVAEPDEAAIKEPVASVVDSIPEPSGLDKDRIESQAMVRASSLEVALNYDLDLKPTSQPKFEVRDPLDPKNPLKMGHLGFKTIRHSSSMADSNGSFDDDTGRITLGRTVMPMLLLGEKRNESDTPLTDNQASWYFSATETLQHEISHTLNPVPKGEYNTTEGTVLEEGLNEDTAMALTIEWMKERDTPADRDALGWLAANLKDHVTDKDDHDQQIAMGTYNSYRGRIAELFDRAGILDPVERRDAAMRMKFSMDTGQRIEFLGQRLTAAGAIPDFEAEYREADEKVAALKPGESTKLEVTSWDGTKRTFMVEHGEDETLHYGGAPTLINRQVRTWQLNDKGEPILGTETGWSSWERSKDYVFAPARDAEDYGEKARNNVVGEALAKGLDTGFLGLSAPTRLRYRGFRPIIDLRGELGDVKPRKRPRVKLPDGTEVEPGGPVIVTDGPDRRTGTVRRLLPNGKLEIGLTPLHPGPDDLIEVEPEKVRDYANGYNNEPLRIGQRVMTVGGEEDRGEIIGIVHVPAGEDSVFTRKKKGAPKRGYPASDLESNVDYVDVAPGSVMLSDGTVVRVGADVEFMPDTGDPTDNTRWIIARVGYGDNVELVNPATEATHRTTSDHLLKPSPVVAINGDLIHLGSTIHVTVTSGTWVVIAIDGQVIKARGPDGEIRTFAPSQVEKVS